MKFLIKSQPYAGGAALLLLVVGIYLVSDTPSDFQQGNAVRILYVHVPSAKMALLSYVVLTVASILYLWRRSETADILAEAAASVGTLFTAVTLASGAIWGKPMWGTWWAWDARLTSVLILLILYIGLMALRNALDDARKAAQAVAVMAIIGAVDLPIIHFSVQWWRTLHQPASMNGPGKVAIVGPLLLPLLVMSVAFVLLGYFMWVVKARAVMAQRELEALEIAKVEHG